MSKITEKDISIGWILQSTRGNAGARIHGYNMHDALIQRGIRSEIAYVPESGYAKEFDLTQDDIDRILIKKYDVIAMTMPNSGDGYYEFIERLHKNGTKLVCIATDNFNKEYASACDHLIVVADFLKEEIPESFRENVSVVFDGYEHDGTRFKNHTDKKEIELVFTSNNVFKAFPQIEEIPENISLKIIGPPPERVEKYGMGKLFTETPYEFKYVVWDLDTFEDEVLKADVAVIPYPDKAIGHDYVKRKSSNRLIMFMSYGLPTIISPNPEYEKIIKHEVNGYIAKTKEEWQEYIKILRDNPDIRKKIGTQAREDVLNKYSYNQQADEYLKIFMQTINNE